MFRLAAFAGLAGLHLAILQFSYFFLLLINVTSTYITYITVVVAWMVGTLVGLLWRRLTPWPSLVMGVVAYYLTCLLVFNAPLAGYTLPVAAIGVAFTGLWAGNLFVALLPMFDRADRLFLHENNGFLVGIVGVFIGFTQLGQTFLLSAPLISGVIQVVFLGWLQIRPPAAMSLSVGGEQSAGYGVLGQLTEAGAQQLRLLAGVAVALNLLFPLGTFVDAALTDQPYWEAFHGEDNAITWFSSIQLVLVGLIAYAIFQTSGLLCELLGSARTRGRWIWLVFALGFVFLGVDEHFELHELLREKAVRDAGLFMDISWMREGDIGLFIYLAIGVAFGVFLLRELRHHMPALWLFVAAVATAAVIVVVDAMPEQVVSTWPAPMFWNSMFEEGGELLGQLLFLLSFTTFLSVQIREIGHVTGVAGE